MRRVHAYNVSSSLPGTEERFDEVVNVSTRTHWRPTPLVRYTYHLGGPGRIAVAESRDNDYALDISEDLRSAHFRGPVYVQRCIPTASEADEECPVGKAFQLKVDWHSHSPIVAFPDTGSALPGHETSGRLAKSTVCIEDACRADTYAAIMRESWLEAP